MKHQLKYVCKFLSKSSTFLKFECSNRVSTFPLITQSLSMYRIAGNIGGDYIWRKSHKLGINNIGEILIWRLSVAVHIGKHAL